MHFVHLQRHDVWLTLEDTKKQKPCPIVCERPFIVLWIFPDPIGFTLHFTICNSTVKDCPKVGGKCNIHHYLLTFSPFQHSNFLSLFRSIYSPPSFSKPYQQAQIAEHTPYYHFHPPLASTGLSYPSSLHFVAQKSSNLSFFAPTLSLSLQGVQVKYDIFIVVHLKQAATQKWFPSRPPRFSLFAQISVVSHRKWSIQTTS